MRAIKPGFIEFAYILVSKAREHEDDYVRARIAYEAAYYLGIGLGGTGVYLPYDNFPHPPPEKCYVL